MPDRLASIKQKMYDAGLDVLVVSSGINRRWLTGFTGSAGTVVISQTGSYLLVDFRYVEQARQQTDAMDVIQYQDLLKALGELFAKINVSRAGFESAHVVHKTLARLQKDIPGVTWVPVETWIEEARGIKTPAELAATEEAVAIADRAFTQILRHIKPGTTERQLAFELEFILRREGAERLAFDTIVA
jgi:Xaa-Pro aminopeptidase